MCGFDESKKEESPNFRFGKLIFVTIEFRNMCATLTNQFGSMIDCLVLIFAMISSIPYILYAVIVGGSSTETMNGKWFHVTIKCQTNQFYSFNIATQCYNYTLYSHKINSRKILWPKCWLCFIYGFIERLQTLSSYILLSL